MSSGFFYAQKFITDGMSLMLCRAVVAVVVALSSQQTTMKGLTTMNYFPYCVKCLKQPDTDTTEFYDYRFDDPTCISCVEEQNLEPECETHTWVLQINIANTPEQNYCEECGATEPADPDDVAEQQRLLEE